MGERGGYEGGNQGMGRGEKKKYQSQDTIKASREAMRKRQLERAMERHENDEKSPSAEVSDVIDYLVKSDGQSNDMPFMTRYLEWLKANINQVESLEVNEGEMENFEKITASVKAGGGGRQTSRNARARVHAITGIRASAEEDRKAGPNEKIVMEKIKAKLKRHLENWRILLKTGKGGVDLDELEEEVLDKIASA